MRAAPAVRLETSELVIAAEWQGAEHRAGDGWVARRGLLAGGGIGGGEEQGKHESKHG